MCSVVLKRSAREGGSEARAPSSGVSSKVQG